MGSRGEVIVLKIKGSQKARISELYKKTTQGVKTSGTYAKAVDKASDKKAAAVKTTESKAKQGVSEARYDDVLAHVDAHTEEFAVKTVASAPDVRKAKVDAIAEAIKNKTYKVDLEAVAERMLASGVMDDRD